MSIPGAEGLIEEMSPGWRRAMFAAITAGSIVSGYFLFVDGRIAAAATMAEHNSARIDGVQADIKDIKGTVIELREKQAMNGQKLEDVKDSVDAINNKIDRLLMQNQRRAQFP